MTAEPIYVPLQPWSCDKCRNGGDVESPDGITAWEAYMRIVAAHRTASFECHSKFGAEYVRVRARCAPTLPAA